MLVSERSRIEGPQQQILDLMLSCLIATLVERGGLPVAEAERLAHMQLARVQAQLAAYMFVVADLDDDPDPAPPTDVLWTGSDDGEGLEPWLL